MTGGPSACRCCRRLSPRPGAGRGDQLPDLQAETAARVATLPARGAAPRGAAASLAHALGSAARGAAPGGRTSATGVLEMRPRRARLRTAVVRRVPQECPGGILLPGPQLLPLVREEEAALVGRAARGCAAARGAPPRGAHHPTPVAAAVSATAGAARRARPRWRRGGQGARPPRERRERRAARDRGLRRHCGRSPSVASASTSDHQRRRPKPRRLLAQVGGRRPAGTEARPPALPLVPPSRRTALPATAVS